MGRAPTDGSIVLHVTPNGRQAEAIDYALLPEELIYPPRHWAVVKALAIARRDLGLGRVTGYWCLPADQVSPKAIRIHAHAPPHGDHQISGFTHPDHPNAYFLDARTLTPIETLLHECRHLWQAARRRTWRDERTPAEVAVDEWDARRYANEAMGRLSLSDVPEWWPQLARSPL